MNKSGIYVGVDVSKLTIDFMILFEGRLIHEVVKNSTPSIRKYLKKIKAQLHVEESDLIIGVENTGRYTWPMLSVFGLSDAKLYLLSPLHLKKSMGMVRGKSDMMDSERIARFISKNADDLALYNPPRQILQQLSILLARRNKVQKLIRIEQSTTEELSCVDPSQVKKFIAAESKKAVADLRKRLLSVENQIEALIRSDEELTRLLNLMMSVPGVGKILSWYLLVKTNEFKNFDDPRKLACYAGVAPFEHSSGTSVRGKTRVSFYADKMLKKILHLAALRVIQLDGELRQFYLKKVAEGKNKMLVINALRNKIIHRIMAAIRDNRPYQKDYKNSLVLS